MENAEIADYPHRWCRVAHRARLWVLLPVVALLLVAAVFSGDVFKLAILAIGVACGAAYSWWAGRKARRGGEPQDAPEGREHRDLHAVLYAKVGWARAAVATDVLTTAVYVAVVLLASVSLWGEGASEPSVASIVAVVLGLGLGTVLSWWEDWVHVRAVGFHVVDSGGNVLSTR